MNESSFNWSIEGEAGARIRIISTLEWVKAEVVKVVELRERQ